MKRVILFIVLEADFKFVISYIKFRSVFVLVPINSSESLRDDGIMMEIICMLL